MLVIITVITAAGKTWFVVMFSAMRISLVLIKEFKPRKPLLLVHLRTSGHEKLCDNTSNSHGPLFGTVLEISTGL